LDWKDIFFFSGLFVLVGAVEASGILNWLGEIIIYISGANILICCLILMWLAGVVTAFLNAGPSTALFLPLVANFIRQGGPAPCYLYFWALSLGVLAGSSATLTGATAGSVSSNLLDEFIESRGNSPATGYSSLSFREYSNIGVPVGIMFLTVSSIYIAAIYRW
jgi:Na+/H+ antiporter NhaD/arsenite permease-like protein